MSFEIRRCDCCEVRLDANDQNTLDGAFWCARCWLEHYVQNCNTTRLEALVARVEALPDRQARTIRRLRALADGYRARHRLILAHVWSEYAVMDQATLTADAVDLGRRIREPVEAKERARIVAALRAYDCCNASIEQRVVLMGAADAIERGEL